MKLRRSPNGTLWTVTSENKILKSADAGKTWVDVSVNKGGFSRSAPIRDFFLDQRTGALLVASDKLYRSNDAGASWNALNLIIPADNVTLTATTMHPANANIIYAASNNVLYKSIDGGNSWSITTLPTSRNVSVIAINPINPGTILIGTTK